MQISSYESQPRGKAMTKPRILVTSAAGKTGLPTALQLLKKGYPVRAFVRRDDHRARRLKEAGAEIFVGDHCVLTDMRRAMKGVQRAYHCAPTDPNGLHFGAVFAIAANENRLEHVVTLGQWLSHPDHPSLFTRESWLNDALVALMPETTATVNNVGWFADNYFLVLEPAAQLGILPMPLGDGDVKKNAPPANEDIASVSVAALIDPAAHAGKVYRPTGPALLSPNEIAAAMAKALGRKIKYQDISEALFLKAVKAQGRPPAQYAQLRYYVRDYQMGAFAVGAPSDAVSVVGGREPEPFESIARRYAAARPEAVRSPASRLGALAFFARMLATRRPDMDAFERDRDHVLLAAPSFARDSSDWRARHDPAAGYVADRPKVAGAPARTLREVVA
jgi:uncharacterized protein YbjT (DUF2867 family)